jgi:hypothetical protein
VELGERESRIEYPESRRMSHHAAPLRHTKGTRKGGAVAHLRASPSRFWILGSRFRLHTAYFATVYGFSSTPRPGRSGYGAHMPSLGWGKSVKKAW